MRDHPLRLFQTPSDTVAGSARAYAIVWLLVVAFILYGSLFPFEYYERSYPGGAVGYLLSTWSDWDHRGDLLSNILLYMPFGFFGTGALPARLRTSRRALLVTIAGTALSCCVEAAQFRDIGRVTSMGDVYANFIGSGLGALTAAAFGASMRWPFIRELAGDPAAAVLLAMFFGYRLYPYVPVIDMHKYWHAVRPMLAEPSLPPDELARFTITWLFIAVIVHALYGLRGFMLLFPLVCGCEFLGRILIVDNSLKLTDVIGAGAAYVLCATVLGRRPGRFAIVALVFGVMILVRQLVPFQFVAMPTGFRWVPFASLMAGSIGVAMQVFCEKFYEYGGLIWLLGRAGMALPVGTGLTTALLFVTSYAECWLPGRSADITDAAMALAIGGIFILLGSAARADAGVVMAGP